jgi:hypothetical protein
MDTAAVERFIVRKEHEWAFVYIDEQTGVFACYSSFGTYAYCWTHIGERTLKEFLRGLNFDYFMGKARPGYRRFDAEATVKGIKQSIIEQRRDGYINKSDARNAWTDAEGLWHDNQHEFFEQLCSSAPLMKFYDGDYCDIGRETPDGNSRGFWEAIWPEFLKQISATAEITA